MDFRRFNINSEIQKTELPLTPRSAMHTRFCTPNQFPEALTRGTYYPVGHACQTQRDRETKRGHRSSSSGRWKAEEMEAGPARPVRSILAAGKSDARVRRSMRTHGWSRRAERQTVVPWPRAPELAAAIALVAKLHGSEKSPRRGASGQWVAVKAVVHLAQDVVVWRWQWPWRPELG
jgi:hypothetical protein